jgi:hypothetical protein
MVCPGLYRDCLPSSLPESIKMGLLLGLKRNELVSNTSSSAEVEEMLELCLYFLLGLHNLLQGDFTLPYLTLPKLT